MRFLVPLVAGLALLGCSDKAGKFVGVWSTDSATLTKSCSTNNNSSVRQTITGPLVLELRRDGFNGANGKGDLVDVTSTCSPILKVSENSAELLSGAEDCRTTTNTDGSPGSQQTVTTTYSTYVATLNGDQLSLSQDWSTSSVTNVGDGSSSTNCTYSLSASVLNHVGQ